MATMEQLQHWDKAQRIELSLDLILAAKLQLRFLAEVHSNTQIFQRHVLERAIERYEFCWLPLANSSVNLMPPLDCGWIWHCHRLNPVQYGKDCKQVFGKIVDAPLLERNEEAYEVSKSIWEANFPDEPYNLDLLSGDMSLRYSNRPRNISYNLLDAVLRQKTFYYQVSEPHYLEESFLKGAVKRYKGFLYLFKQQGTSTFFVPTYDIDLMWHAHQLSPVHYESDIIQLLGHTLDHDDTDNNRDAGGKLDNGFLQTRALWEKTYGICYEKAGCMYRGEPPSYTFEQPVLDPMKLSTLSTHNEWINKQRSHLTSRKMIKVHLSIRGVKGLQDETMASVTITLLDKFKRFKLQTVEKNVSSQWDNQFTFQVETSTKGLVLELKLKRHHTVSRLFLGRKKGGKLVIPWDNVINSDMESLNDWFILGKARNDQPPYSLHVCVSVTPPVNGPYLLRSVRARDTGDDMETTHGHSEGMWITKTVYDHANEEVFIIRYRYKRGGLWRYKALPETDKVVHVHQGGWNYYGSTNRGMVPGKILGSAWQVTDPVSLSTSRKWSLLDGSIILTVRKNQMDPKWNLRPELQVEGSFDCPIVLFPGRKLQFAVLNASEMQEAGFVTMVRYTRDAPQGKATALFNWRSGGMQIDYDEDILLVLLLSTTIGMSVSEMLGRKIAERDRDMRLPDSEGFDHWEAADDGGGDGGGDGGIVGDCGQSWWVEAGHCQDSNSGGASNCGGGFGGGCGAATGGIGGGGGGGSGGSDGGCGGNSGGDGGCGGSSSSNSTSNSSSI